MDDDAFLDEVRRRPDLLVARGQCVEPYGVGEAYLPFLEALGELCRGARGAEVVALLEQRAPTWLVQMPWLVRAGGLGHLDRRVASATRDRMLRELAEALEALTVEWPLVLVLEDLHGSDPSTRALIAWLARRQESARLLVVNTYRSAELIGSSEVPMHALEQELALRGRCEELPLKPLTEAGVAEHVAARLGSDTVSPEIARLLHQRTDGHPLFMASMLELWLAHGWLASDGGAWTLSDDPRALDAEIPESLRQMVERSLARLDPAEQRLLEIASVAGLEFSAAAAAAGLGEDLAEAEARCASAARRGQLLRAIGEEAWPDGTISGRYAFAHTLYRDVCYAAVAPALRTAAHRDIGGRLEAAYGARRDRGAARDALRARAGLSPRGDVSPPRRRGGRAPLRERGGDRPPVARALARGHVPSRRRALAPRDRPAHRARPRADRGEGLRRARGRAALRAGAPALRAARRRLLARRLGARAGAARAGHAAAASRRSAHRAPALGRSRAARAARAGAGAAAPGLSGTRHDVVLLRRSRGGDARSRMVPRTPRSGGFTRRARAAAASARASRVRGISAGRCGTAGTPIRRSRRAAPRSRWPVSSTSRRASRSRCTRWARCTRASADRRTSNGAPTRC